MSEEESKKRKADDDAPPSDELPPVKKVQQEATATTDEAVADVDATITHQEQESAAITVEEAVAAAQKEQAEKDTENGASEVNEKEVTGQVEVPTATATTAETITATDASNAQTDETPAPVPEASTPNPEIDAIVATPPSETPTDPSPAPAPVASSLPPGVPEGVPMALNNAPAPTSAHSQPTQTQTMTEKQDMPVQYVGRIIGKGGEQIRDLQARSACKVDVDQNVPNGAPRVITYHGTKDKIDFAKSLVNMLCQENWKNVELPLGFASRAVMQVPGTVIGKIIGRGGEMIKELQSKSYAKIQVDHNSGGDTGFRTVTITGNELSVKRAEEMINLIIANPLADASGALDMLIKEKAQGISEWGSGPPYSTMPNNGVNMPSNNYGGGGEAYGGGYRQPQQNSYQPQQQQQQPPVQNGGGGGGGGYGQQPHQQSYSPSQQQPPASQGHGQYGAPAGAPGGMESEVFYSSKMYMGRIIGQKGITINDLQKRSGCDIQINQNVPAGQDCEVHIKGVRQGVENAKQMLNEIIQMGPNHTYAGGRGAGGGGGGGGASGGGGYQQQVGYGQQQQSYGQPHSQNGQNQYQQQPYGQQQNQNQYTQQPWQQSQNQYVHPQQTQMQQQQPPQQYGASTGQVNYGAYYGGQQAQAPPQAMYQQPPPAAALSPWKAATSPDGQVYYYNEKTNDTTWDKPAGMP